MSKFKKISPTIGQFCSVMLSSISMMSHFRMLGNVNDILYNNASESGSGWGSVGRAVASNTRGPQFESSHWQTFKSDILLVYGHLFWKDENKEKEAGNGPFFERVLKLSCRAIPPQIAQWIRVWPYKQETATNTSVGGFESQSSNSRIV